MHMPQHVATCMHACRTQSSIYSECSELVCTLPSQSLAFLSQLYVHQDNIGGGGVEELANIVTV